MQDISLCYDTSLSGGGRYRKIYFDMHTNFVTDVAYRLTYNLYGFRHQATVDFVPDIFEYGRKMPKSGCSAPQKKAGVSAKVEKEEVSVAQSSKKTPRMLLPGRR